MAIIHTCAVAQGPISPLDLPTRFCRQPGVDVNQPTLNPQRTFPLHIAAWHCPSLVPLLLQKGASVNDTDGYGQTPL